MFQKFLLFNIVLFFCLQNTFAQRLIKGKITDGRTKEPIAFASVAVSGTSKGTLSDIDGNFSLTLPSGKTQVLVSCVGYEPIRMEATGSFLKIVLKEAASQLTEVVVRRQANPALAIINKVIENRDLHDPEKLQSFAYKSYNKFYVPSNQDWEKEPKDRKSKDIRPAKRQSRETNIDITIDSTLADIVKNAEFFLTETFTERKFIKPNLSKEVVLATKTTGTKSPLFASLPLDVQPFGFYNDFIVMFGKNYLSPIAKGSTRRYDYQIKDTLVADIDTTFVLSFEPLADKNFEAMKGLLYISTDRYAVANVIAAPMDTIQFITFKMQQKYVRVGDTKQWFPLQLNTDVKLKITMDNGSVPFKYVSRSYFSDIQVNPEITKKGFNYLVREIAPDATLKPDTLWKQYRTDTLSKREANSYRLWETKLKDVGASLDRATYLMEYILVGEIPYRKVSFPIRHLFRINRYEGLRLGLGIKTNELYSKHVQLEANVGFGLFGDWALKYGGGAQFNLGNRRDARFRIAYKQDIDEPANVDFFALNPITERIESYRNFLVERVDSVRQIQAELSLRALRHGHIFLTLQNEYRNPTYNYRFLPKGDVSQSQNEFNVSEISLGIRYAYGEKYTQFGRSKVLLEMAFPVVTASVSRGLPNFLGSGNWEYTKVNLKIEERWNWRTLGATSLTAFGGKIWGDVPYSYLYNFRGASGTGGLAVPNYFQTMGLYEFTSNEYVSVFLQHNFGQLLYKPKNPKSWFQPELVLMQGVGFGRLSNAQNHEIIDLKVPEKGFFESGMMLNNLLFQRLGPIRLGYGIGIFRRFGEYILTEEKKNWSFKFSGTISF